MLGNELRGFAQNELVLGRSTTERESIDRSIDALKSCINRNLNIPYCDMVVFGSYTRNTILPRAYDSASDIDILVAMDNENVWFPQNVEDYRGKLRGAISKTYPTSDVVRDFPCVKLVLNHIKFDIVPALKNSIGYGYLTYKIPDRYYGWMTTTPNDINGLLEEGNKAAGDNKLRNLIRLCKHWNSAREGKAWDSYHLEKTVIERYAGWAACSYGADPFLETFLTAIDGLSWDLSNRDATRNCVKMCVNICGQGTKTGNVSGCGIYCQHLILEHGLKNDRHNCNNP